MLKNESFNPQCFGDSYEKFMTKHLQHYGFYSGKNKFTFKDLEGYEKTHGYSASEDSHSDNQDELGCAKNLEQLRLLKTTQLVYNIFDDGRIIPKLKAPHILHHDFIINLRQAPRWPVEMQILPGKISHIRTMPLQKEPLYEPNGSEARPQTKNEDKENIIYEYNTFSGPFFIKSKFPPSAENCNLKSLAIDLQSNSDETLLFESRFESGNLEKVYKVGPYEYELHLRTDMYTSKHTQWYYFRVMNTKANRFYRFTIVNLYKANSLYNDGLKPLMYSEKDAQQYNKGWRRWGSNIVYYRNNRRYMTQKGEKCFFSLTWTCNFLYDNDTVYMSHCYPYTYSDLMQYIDRIKNDSVKSWFCKIKLLTYSLADNLSILLTITNPTTDSILEKKKKIIIITGRVHPGESNASWMMEGVLDYLLSNKPDAKLLRDLFIFKIVPMINPDGVIVGNYRCSLSGRDLNRNYKTQLKSSYPIIASIRTMIDRILKEKEILFYFDLHGHSRKHNIFMYGCNDHSDENDFLLERAFPVLLNKNLPDKFDDRSCKFKMQKSKSGTGRIVFRNLGIMHSFTIEASFCGSTLSSENKADNPRQYHFNTDDLKSLGEAFCNSLLDFCDPDQKNINTIIANIKHDLTSKYMSKLESQGLHVDVNKTSLVNLSQLDLSDDDDSSADDNGSDSSDSNGLPAHYEYMDKQLQINKKKIPKAKDKDIKEDGKGKEMEMLKHILGGRCSTCLHLSKNSPNLKTKLGNQQLDKSKLISASIKMDMKNTDMKEKMGFIRKSQTIDVIKRDSLNDSIKRNIQELETPKIHLHYCGKSQLSKDINDEQLCHYHETESKESSLKQNSFINPWRPSGAIPESLHNHTPFKPKTGHRLKSGFLSKKIQQLRFSPHSDYENNTKSFGMFSQKPLNPIKRVQPISLIKKPTQDSTLKILEKSYSIYSIDS